MPPDDESGYWLSPTVRVDRGAFKVADVFEDGGVPITMQREDHPVAGPLIVPKYAAVLASAEPTQPSGTFKESGIDRFELLGEYGLDSEASVDAQLNALSDAALIEIASELLNHGRRTLDLLALNSALPEPANTLWTESSTVASMVGQTMLWADHYLSTDSLLDAFLRSEVPDRDGIREAVIEMLRLRPLVEAGVVVPVPAGTAVLLVAEAIHESTRLDLEDSELMEWLYRQMVIEGPTAREVAFVQARDDDREADFYTHSRMAEFNDDGTFRMGVLQPYDPTCDYRPWLRTVRSQYAARLTQELNQEIAIARFFGGEYVTRAPFRARFAHRRTAATSAPALAASINVPWLPNADPATLAKIASQDEAVHDLRRRMAGAIRHVSDTSSGQRELSDLVDEIAEDAVGPLARKLERDRAWRLVVPGACSVGTVILGATTGPMGAIVGAALGLGAWAGPAFADFKEPRTEAAYVFWSAQRHDHRRSKRSR